jgi:UDP-N-acetylglucosamine 2-epimerase (non-hydrolysing)
MKNLELYELNKNFSENIRLIDPLGYVDFLHLIENADLLITDSGGIQEETTYLGVQCITVRDSTERPVTVDEGTNQLIGTDIQKVKEAALDVINGRSKTGQIPERWDGKSSDRIVEILIDSFSE